MAERKPVSAVQKEIDAARAKRRLKSRPAAAPAKKMMAEHTVAKGETLGAISLKYYNSAVKDKYMKIYDANKATIGDNPNRIKTGMVLNIPALD